ncbi:hypothetical protein FACS1894201_06040 [Bacteroidia bacterium]|nr:hypothetical protein FACS1894201_06040 [Bacteroidia bacterium]
MNSAQKKDLTQYQYIKIFVYLCTMKNKIVLYYRKTMAKMETEINAYNIISAGTKFKGDFNATGNIRIDGDFEGSVITNGKLIVGQNGVVSGTVICQTAEFEGTIKANVEVKDYIAIKAAANITGDIKTDKISIETGAVFNGFCKMTDVKQTDNLKK